PFVACVQWLLGDIFGFGSTCTGIFLGAFGVVLLFVALICLVKILRSIVLAKVERFFGKYLFRNAVTAFIVGLLLTASVQSSSVTTSLLVPLVGAGLLTLRQIFPYILGTGLGTTVTAMLASFAAAAASPERAQLGIALALAHFLFNFSGACIWFPLKAVPIRMSHFFAWLCRRSRKWPILWVAVLFYLLPGAVLLIYSLFRN
ncbi:MAG: Na/Pi symporter, partial [Phycisphaerae bacterium]|nr:Na/Pi symporter [Phycisphaerae bacterium]